MSQDPGAAGGPEQQPTPYSAPIPAPDEVPGGNAPAPMYGGGDEQRAETQQPYGAPAYGQVPAYGQDSQYGQVPAYGQGLPPGQAPVYGQASPYGQAPAYGPSSPYGPAGVGQLPTYGPPAYGYPPAQPYGPAGGWDTPKTDPLSVAAFVVALTGIVVVITFPIGLGLGIAGMVRAKRRGLGGRGFAIAAVVIGALGTLVVGGGIALLIGLGNRAAFDGSSSSHSSRSSSGPARADDTSSTALPDYRLVQGLTPGECLEGDTRSWSLEEAVPVSCTAQHNLEVVSVYQLTERPVNSTEQPGPELDEAQSTCENDVLAANSSLLGSDDWSDVWAPHPVQWDAGQTSAYCLWGTDSEVSGSATQGFGAQSSAL